MESSSASARVLVERPLQQPRSSPPAVALAEREPLRRRTADSADVESGLSACTVPIPTATASTSARSSWTGVGVSSR